MHSDGDVVGVDVVFDQVKYIFLKPSTCKIFQLMMLENAFFRGRELDVIQELTQIRYRHHRIVDGGLHLVDIDVFPIAVFLAKHLHYFIVAVV